MMASMPVGMAESTRADMSVNARNLQLPKLKAKPLVPLRQGHDSADPMDPM